MSAAETRKRKKLKTGPPKIGKLSDVNFEVQPNLSCNEFANKFPDACINKTVGATK